MYAKMLTRKNKKKLFALKHIDQCTAKVTHEKVLSYYSVQKRLCAFIITLEYIFHDLFKILFYSKSYENLVESCKFTNIKISNKMI